ncbi:MAG TPA: hypothetical protein VF808_14775 [Ktedonobacterales bacterium]
MLKQEEEARIETPSPAATPPIAQPEALPPVAGQETRPSRRGMSGAVVGLVLVAVGVMALIGNLWPSEIMGLLVLPTLGAIFLVWAFWARVAGLLIPGSILFGLGLGVLLQQTLFIALTGQSRGGIVVLGLALGFLAIMPLVQILERRFQWWPAIPGGILLAVALALLSGSGGIAVLEALNTLWPLALIAVGAYLLWMFYWTRGRGRDRERHGLPS